MMSRCCRAAPTLPAGSAPSRCLPPSPPSSTRSTSIRASITATTLHLNDIAFCNISTSVPVAFDPYSENRKTGSFIIIDRFKNQTVGAGMVDFGLRRGTNIHWQPLLIGRRNVPG